MGKHVQDLQHRINTSSIIHTTTNLHLGPRVANLQIYHTASLTIDICCRIFVRDSFDTGNKHTLPPFPFETPA